MQKRLFFFAVVAGAFLWGLGAPEARAALVPLPTTLDQLLPPGTTTQASSNTETDTFSNFSYVSGPGANVPPPASGVTVQATNQGIEGGLTFVGAFTAPPGQTVDYAIGYTVTAAPGQTFTDALLSGTVVALGAGSSGSVSETLTTNTGKVLSLVIGPGNPIATVDGVALGPGVTSISVGKDIALTAGAATGSTASISIINQLFSSTGIPEPASMALLGIGMTGFLAFRRFFKRISVA
jgi:hypothetical protein